MSARGEGEEGRQSLLWRFLPLGIVVVGLVAGYVMGWHRLLTLDYLADSREGLRAYVEAHYLLSLGAFLLVYALAVAFSFPAASVLTVFAGFLFGWLAGGAVVAVAATLGATAIFVAARTAFGDVLRRRLGARVARLADGFEKDAFGYLLVLRLAPVFPFWLVNIAPALFDVRLGVYVAATFLGILPATFAFAWLGQGVDSVMAAAQAAGREATLSDLVTLEITLAFAALALVAAIPTIVRKVRGRQA